MATYSQGVNAIIAHILRCYKQSIIELRSIYAFYQFQIQRMRTVIESEIIAIQWQQCNQLIHSFDQSIPERARIFDTLMNQELVRAEQSMRLLNMIHNDFAQKLLERERWLFDKITEEYTELMRQQKTELLRTDKMSKSVNSCNRIDIKERQQLVDLLRSDRMLKSVDAQCNRIVIKEQYMSIHVPSESGSDTVANSKYAMQVD